MTYANVGDTVPALGNLTIVSHTYENGIGKLKMSGPITGITNVFDEDVEGGDGVVMFDENRTTKIILPNSLITIDEMAFEYCYSLNSITIPNSVTSIGNYTFNGCTSLESVICNPTTPPSLGINVFYGNKSGRKIKVPSGSVDAYKTATNWSSYARDIISQ